TRFCGGLAPVAHLSKGRLCGQSRRGACRSEGLIAGEHVPDRLSQPAGEVDLGDLGTALLAQAALVALIALAVERVLAGVGGGLHQRPAQVLPTRRGSDGRDGRLSPTGRPSGTGRYSRTASWDWRSDRSRRSPRRS